jgi:hypothetical protein
VNTDPGTRYVLVESPERRYLAALAAAVVILGVIVLFASGTLGRAGQGLHQLSDPDSAAKGLALRSAQDVAELDFSSAWELYSPCYQQVNPKTEWVALKQSEVNGAARPLPGTRYDVAAVEQDGIYTRVEVRISSPGRPATEYEIDVRQFNGRWVVVDTGQFGHPIGDYCTQGGGS